MQLKHVEIKTWKDSTWWFWQEFFLWNMGFQLVIWKVVNTFIGLYAAFAGLPDAVKHLF